MSSSGTKLQWKQSNNEWTDLFIFVTVISEIPYPEKEFILY